MGCTKCSAEHRPGPWRAISWVSCEREDENRALAGDHPRGLCLREYEVLMLRSKLKVAQPITIREEAKLYQGTVPATSIWPELLHTVRMGLGIVGEAGRGTGRGTSKALLVEPVVGGTKI